METSSVAHSLTSRFVAGLHLEDAIRAARNVGGAGTTASLDYLGENVASLDEARASRDAYLTALTRIAETGLDATVSMKVTALGLDLSEGACRKNTEALVQKAHQAGSRIECDMEASEYTNRNLAIVRDMHARYGSVRAVIQAYLYRSEADVADLCERRIPVRLCKGAYQEPASVAHPGKAEVDGNYVKLMKKLLDCGEYPALATHDDRMVEEAIQYVRDRKIASERFEFQMLYGIRRRLQRRLVEQGFRLRIYIPYGAAWYPYFMRRLAERPANVVFLANNLFRG